MKKKRINCEITKSNFCSNIPQPIILNQLNQNDEKRVHDEYVQDVFALKKIINNEFIDNFNNFRKILIDNLDVDLEEKNSILKIFDSVFEYAIKCKGLDYQKLRPNGRYEYLAIIILYYSLLINGYILENKKSNIIPFVKPFLAEYKLNMKDLSLNYFYEFLSDEFKKILFEKQIKFKVSYKISYENNEFKEEFDKSVNIFLERLKNSDFFKKLNINLEEKINIGFNKISLNFLDIVKNFFNDIIKIISTNNKQKINIHKSLGDFNSPSLLAGAIIYICLHVYYDICDTILLKDDFERAIAINNNVGSYVKYYMTNYLKINEVLYKQHVLEYCKKFLIKINENYDIKLSLDDLDNVIKRANDFFVILKKSKVIVPKNRLDQWKRNNRSNELFLYNILSKYGFDLNLIVKNDRYGSFLPSYIAFVLIFLLNNIFGKKILFNKEELAKILGINFGKVKVLIWLYELMFQAYTNHKLRYSKNYLRETFINDLQSLLKNYFHIETKFFLDLYKLTDLEPDEFVFRLNILPNKPDGRKRGAGSFILYLKGKYTLTKNSSIRKIKDFIFNNLDSEKKEEGFCLFNNLIKIRSVLLRHRKVKYVFRYNSNNISVLLNPNIKLCFMNYIRDIVKGNYPTEEFNNYKNPRPSMLYISGDLNEKLRDSYVKTNLIDPLLEKNKLICFNLNNIDNHLSKKYGIIYNLIDDIDKLYDEYNFYIGNSPSHYPVLTNLIIRDDFVLANEGLIWKKIKNSENYYIGHIDGYLANSNTLFIIDLKRDENDVYRSLLQVSGYGLMVRYLFNERYNSNFGNFDIKCISCTREQAFLYDPNILEEDILNFVRKCDNERVSNGLSPLKSKRLYKGAILTNLYDDILRLIK